MKLCRDQTRMKHVFIFTLIILSMVLTQDPSPPCPEKYHEAQGNCVKCAQIGCKWCNTTNVICQECSEGYEQDGTEQVGDIHSTIKCKAPDAGSESTVLMIVIFVGVFLVLLGGGLLLRWMLQRNNKPAKRRSWEMKRRQKYDKERAKEARNAKYRQQEINIKQSSKSKKKSKRSSGRNTPQRRFKDEQPHTPSTNPSSSQHFIGYMDGIEDQNQFAESYIDSVHVGEFTIQQNGTGNHDDPDTSNAHLGVNNQANKQWFDENGRISPRW